MDGVFVQVELGDAVGKDRINGMLTELGKENVRFKEAHGNNTSCYGFIDAEIDELDEEKIMGEVERIISDVELENEDQIYEIRGYKVIIGY